MVTVLHFGQCNNKDTIISKVNLYNFPSDVLASSFMFMLASRELDVFSLLNI